MALHIIIDGYNLIRQSTAFRQLDLIDLQAGRDALIEALTAYKRIKGHKISIVFDGTRAPEFSPRRERIGGIHVRFSRLGESADSVIKRMAAREREKALVVTSDRDVYRAAQSCGSATIDSGEFETKLMMAGGIASASAEDEASGWVPTTKKKGPRRRLPKRQRRSRKKIAKL